MYGHIKLTNLEFLQKSNNYNGTVKFYIIKKVQYICKFEVQLWPYNISVWGLASGFRSHEVLIAIFETFCV